MSARLGKRKHLLLTKELRAALPPLYSQDGKGDEAEAVVKFFTPMSGWTWFATEFDGEDTFFGYVESGLDPSFDEFAYFSLSELEELTAMNGLLPAVERDLYFDTGPVREVARKKVAA